VLRRLRSEAEAFRRGDVPVMLSAEVVATRGLGPDSPPP
jgi:hypothetical protein